MEAEPFDTAVAEVYADGGCAGANPSPHAGLWAWRHVNAGSGVVAEASGVIVPEIGKSISNNVTEFAALLFALEALPHHWTGKVFTDSGVTLMRFRDPAGVKMKGVPGEYLTRLSNLRRFLGRLDFVLLGGHPTRAELGAGRRKDGKPVSIHNVWADQECGRQARIYAAANRPSRVPKSLLAEKLP